MNLFGLLLPVLWTAGGALLGGAIIYGVKKAEETKNPYDDVLADGVLWLLREADDKTEGTQLEELLDSANEMVDKELEDPVEQLALKKGLKKLEKK